MINPPAYSSYYGGAGIYATNYDYYYASPTNIQGAYAAYFVGNVASTGNLTVNSMYTTCDSRLSDNIMSLSGTRESGKSTLENLLGMNVIEYNLKPRLKEVIPEDVSPEKAERLRKELEYLKQQEQKLTSRRHFGIDAQEVQQIYPDLVMEGEDGQLAVNYLEMVPLVIRSIQELKQEMDEMKDGVDETAKMPLASAIANTDAPVRNVLFRNTPNPAREKTAIRFQLADDVRNAAIGLVVNGSTYKKTINIQ